MTKAVVSVVGKDRTGIIYNVTKILYENNINILDISQTIMQDIFTMVMLVDIKDSKIEFKNLEKILREKGIEIGTDIKICHEDIFNSMHRI